MRSIKTGRKNENILAHTQEQEQGIQNDMKKKSLMKKTCLVDLLFVLEKTARAQ